MERKRLARLMIQHGIAPRSRGKRQETTEQEVASPPPPALLPGRRLSDAFHEVPPAADKSPQSVYTVPDSWTPRGNQPTAPEVRADAELDHRKGPKKKAPHKRRSHALPISVSDEEQFLLRKYAFDKGLSFSEWARVVLFREMKVKVPPRS